MANPLKKITAEAKRIRKRKPKTSWKSAVKQAGKKFRAGKIRAPKKRKVSAVKPRKRAKKRKRTARKKPVTTVVVRKTATTVRARRVGRSAPVRRHRMAGRGGNSLMKFMPIVLLGAAAFLIWKAMKPAAPALPPGTPPVYQSSNPVRNDQTNSILQYAIAAGLAFDAISKLINSLNSRGDSDIANIYDELDRGGELPATLYV